MKRINLNASPETVSAVLVIAAVLTTAPRHIISVLQLEGVVISGVVWSVALAVLSIFFAALEGVALLQIERAQSVATDAERKRLSIIKTFVYLVIPATFVAPLVAQSHHIKLADLLAGFPAALWLLAALNAAAPMIVVSAAAASGSVLSAHARTTATPRKSAPAIAETAEPPVRVSKPRARQLPEPETLPDELRAEIMPEAQATDSASDSTPEPTGEERQRAGSINRAELAAMLAANPALTSGALAEHFRVSPAAIRLTDEWKARKG